MHPSVFEEFYEQLWLASAVPCWTLKRPVLVCVFKKNKTKEVTNCIFGKNRTIAVYSWRLEATCVCKPVFAFKQRKIYSDFPISFLLVNFSLIVNLMRILVLFRLKPISKHFWNSIRIEYQEMICTNRSKQRRHSSSFHAWRRNCHKFKNSIFQYPSSHNAISNLVSHLLQGRNLTSSKAEISPAGSTSIVQAIFIILLRSN
jgi:hypothetical protein